jgi:hypothetical protein
MACLFLDFLNLHLKVEAIEDLQLQDFKTSI